MENAVAQFANMRLLEHDIKELSRKTKLLDVQFSKEIIKYDTALRRMNAVLAKNEKYLNFYKH